MLRPIGALPFKVTVWMGRLELTPSIRPSSVWTSINLEFRDHQTSAKSLMQDLNRTPDWQASGGSKLIGFIQAAARNFGERSFGSRLASIATG